MSSKAISISNEVIGLLNGGTFSPSFTSELALALNLESLDLSTLHVFVTPLTCETERISRAQRTKTFTIAVSVFQHVAKVEADFPALMALTEAIDTYLTDENRLVLPTNQAHLTETSTTTYDYTFAEEQSLFLGVVLAQYKVAV